MVAYPEETFFTISTNSPDSLPKPKAAVNNLADSIGDFSSIFFKLVLRASRSDLVHL